MIDVYERRKRTSLDLDEKPPMKLATVPRREHEQKYVHDFHFSQESDERAKAVHAGLVMAKGHPSYSPLGSVLAQYKEAEIHWAKEKVH